MLDILVEAAQSEGKGYGGKVIGVRTSKGDIRAPVVVNCTAGWASQLSNMAGVTLPLTTHPLRRPSRAGEDLPADRGRVRLAARLRQPDRPRRTRLRRLGRPRRQAHGRHTPTTEGSPGMARAHAGHLEDAPAAREPASPKEYNLPPVMGPTPVDGFYVDVGWGTYGFEAGPVSGEQMAACVRTASRTSSNANSAVSPREPSSARRCCGGALIMLLVPPYCGFMNADLSYNGESHRRPDRRPHARGVAHLSVPAGEPVGLVARTVLQFWLPQAWDRTPHPHRRVAGAGAHPAASPVRPGRHGSHRLLPVPGEVIDRSSAISFTWNGKKLQGFGRLHRLGAPGQRRAHLGRSMKYHRPAVC